ncbi:hypothetical protein [Desulfosporosinus sp. Sb-LF]|uniref:hypothetical protein n=1 Tax=Desulfosporosinus sp. Sb-LF TaxID=2560027 RepID=UPI00107F0AFC|nr:hypothetical protein [Desulfosporosinus sp. Sb-LF]TGE34253.1 hypothetical protein E4K68_00665 [Desulfosporosinus sp. Sb-LF]
MGDGIFKGKESLAKIRKVVDNVDFKRYFDYTTDIRCSIEGCESTADFEVILYDHYLKVNKIFAEQDLTCPFMCKKHMDENEVNAKGDRVPRGRINYPFSNQHSAQGYTKYSPLVQ